MVILTKILPSRMSSSVRWPVSSSPNTHRSTRESLFWYCHSRFALYEAATSELEKYDAISDLVACRKKHGVRLDREARERQIELAGELKRMDEDPELKGEIEARRLFFKVHALDEPARLLSKRGEKTPVLRAVVASYEQVAESCPRTVYGRKAAARAEMLRLEWGLIDRR